MRPVAVALAFAAALLPAKAQGLRDLAAPRRGGTLQFASTDPSGGNEDNGHCLRTLADGTCVLAEVDGPGRVVRIWSANPEGELRIEVDGATVFAGPFARLFDGSTPPFAPPLAVRYAGGCVSHVPVPFQRRLYITAAPVAGRYHQITVRTGDEAEAFAMPPGPRLTGELRNLVAPCVDDGTWSTVTGVEVAASTTLLSLPGPAEVVEMRGGAGDGGGLWLFVFADHAAVPTLAAPWSLLFAELPPTLVSGAAGGLRSLRLPMPCRRDLRFVAVRRDGVGPPPIVDFAARSRPLPAGAAPLYLHGACAHAVTRYGEPFQLLDRAGRAGHFVGVVAEFFGAAAQGFACLEGDEAIALDDRPPLRGTGTEDFFSGAWYFRGAPSGSLFHAVTVQESPPHVVAARFCVADAMPFAQHVAIALEHGGHNDAAGAAYRTLTFWYDGDQEGEALPPAPLARPVGEAASTVAASWRWPALAPGGGDVNLRAGALPLPPRAGPSRLTLLHHGAVVAGPFDLAAAADAFVLPAAVVADAVRCEPLLPALRDFTAVGPFACRERHGLDRDWPPETAPDATEFDLGDGTRARWQAVTADAAGIVDLYATWPRECAVACVRTVCTVAHDQDTVLWLGSDDAVRVRLDGRTVHEHRGVRGTARDQDRVPLHLAAGRHVLLFTVENYRGGFGLMARLDSER